MDYGLMIQIWFLMRYGWAKVSLWSVDLWFRGRWIVVISSKSQPINSAASSFSSANGETANQ
jgi:hypothetical protein